MDDDLLPPRPDPPPLRIHHLMVCAVVAAVQLSLLRFYFSLSGEQKTIASAGVFGLTQVLSSVGLTLTGFSIYWWRKGYASFSQPGQMLLIQYAASLLTFVVSVLVRLFLFGPGGAYDGSRAENWIWLYMYVLAGASLLFGILLPCAFYFWCAWKIADTWAWRLLFVLCAVTTVLTSSLAFILIQCFRSIGPSDIRMMVGIPHLIRGSMLLAAGLLAAVTDWTSKRQRSWTSWAGIILWILGQIGTLLTGLYYIFVWQVP